LIFGDVIGAGGRDGGFFAISPSKVEAGLMTYLPETARGILSYPPAIRLLLHTCPMMARIGAS
jgi:hypothetical protein